jgi:excisionase family DNA binding protein
MMYTTNEAAAILKISPDSVRALIVSRRLKAANIGQPGQRSAYRITQEALDEFIARATVMKLPVQRRKKPAEPRRRWLA